MGTAFYMSPEQIRGEKLDARSDLFSLGLVLFEMVTGRRAFRGSTGAAVHDAVLHGSPVPVRELNPAVPAGVESVIRRSLEKERDRRYQSAKELHADLERLNLRRSPSLSGIGARIAAGFLLLSLIILGANVGGLRDRILRRPISNDNGPAIEAAYGGGRAWLQESFGEGGRSLGFDRTLGDAGCTTVRRATAPRGFQ
jgi:serine/threonine protein kinase